MASMPPQVLVSEREWALTAGEKGEQLRYLNGLRGACGSGFYEAASLLIYGAGRRGACVILV